MAVVECLAFESFVADTTRKLALERASEIVGEAPRRVSHESRNAHAEIPWRLIIGQRDIPADAQFYPPAGCHP